MAGTTAATFGEIENAVQRHHNTANDLTKANNDITSEVDGLVAVNTGRLMMALNQLQDEWSGKLKKVITQVEQMAELLGAAGRKLQAQDEAAGAGQR